ncbi:TetR family transcriptional regulator [Acuticoccus sediminis]|uniref:TetR family transcriptional regulator n=1 Tax=Acuticoccus sediminis TaxID=2184697 RepID=A0A8B2NJF1_9HYPH|nr:TetR family transcriptional regulator [Acuticoccus sediminis]RAH95776.1 TetR family transcriptional regulator [Acuticoccus sediminis]
MRVSRAQAAANRENVITAASRLFREHGFDGIGLIDLMKSAGLTQGAFYKQFKSKDDLAALAVGRAMEGTAERWATAAKTEPENPIAALTDLYLSPGHRDDVGAGCPIVALGADAARGSESVRAALEAGIRERLDVLTAHMASDPDARRKAVAMGATMVGALLLARAVNDEALSDEVLTVAREELRRSIGAS